MPLFIGCQSPLNLRSIWISFGSSCVPRKCTVATHTNTTTEATADASGLQVSNNAYATWFFEDNVITTFAGSAVTEDAWESNIHINLAADKGLFLGGVEVVTYDAATGGNIIINNAIIDGGTYN